MCFTTQVDNPATCAAYPVAVTSPHTWSGFGRVVTAVAAAATAGVPRPAAVCLRWSVWRSRPGNVFCIEQVQLQAAPVLLEIEQAHVMQLLAHAQAVMAPLKQESLIAVRYYFRPCSSRSLASCCCWVRPESGLATQHGHVFMTWIGRPACTIGEHVVIGILDGQTRKEKINADRHE